ncbi:MAG: SdpI family protein [Clostridia bacterium]|nr:SdpI family protein [Clostridia bacterium]
MAATWILCIFILLIIPFLTLQCGFLRMNRCAKLGAERGYRSQLAMSSPEAWAYAQKACTVRYMITGVVMALLSLLIAFSLPTDSALNLFIFTGTLLLFQTAAVIVLIATVESELRNRYAPKKEA